MDRGPHPGDDRISDSDAELYASQIVMPEIGVRGQAKLLAANVLAIGADPGLHVARRYLCGAGVSVHEAPSADVSFDCTVIADLDWLVGPRWELTTLLPSPVVGYRLEGTTIRSGIVADVTTSIDDAHAERSYEALSDPSARVVHRLAGAEVAMMTVAYLLDWSPVGATFCIDLGNPA